MLHTPNEAGLVQPGKRIYGATIGIAIMDRRFARPVGDLGHPGSFPFPVLYDVIAAGTRPLSVAQTGELFQPLYESCMRLIDQGASAIATTCGYASLLQAQLAEALPVPFVASSLVQIPSVLATLGGNKKIGVLAARGHGLTGEHLTGTGVAESQLDRITVVDLQQSPAFKAAILDNPGQSPLDVPAATREIAELCKSIADADPQIGGFVAECSNTSLYSPAIQALTGLPVWDSVGLVNWLHSSSRKV